MGGELFSSGGSRCRRLLRKRAGRHQHRPALQGDVGLLGGGLGFGDARIDGVDGIGEGVGDGLGGIRGVIGGFGNLFDNRVGSRFDRLGRVFHDGLGDIRADFHDGGLDDLFDRSGRGHGLFRFGGRGFGGRDFDGLFDGGRNLDGDRLADGLGGSGLFGGGFARFLDLDGLLEVVDFDFKGLGQRRFGGRVKAFDDGGVLQAFDVAGDRGLLTLGINGTETELTLPKSNVLAFFLEGGSKVIVRPSGTEPKIKTYLAAKQPTHEEAEVLEKKLHDEFSKNFQ